DALNELETLRRLVDATINAADEAQETFQEIVDELEAAPTLEELRETTGRFADEFQLNDRERAIINDQLATVDETDLRESIERARSDGLAPVTEAARAIYDITASEFAEREYLR